MGSRRRTRPRSAERQLIVAPLHATGLLLIAGWLGLAPAAHAQIEPLAPGRDARLYVRGAADMLEGRLTSVSRESLQITLLDGSSFTVPVEQLERAEVLAARTNTMRGAIVGGGLGLGVGVALVVRDRNETNSTDGDEFGTSFDAWKLIVPPVAGALLGGLAGRLIRTSEWAPAFVAGAGGGADFALAWTIAVAP
jgi:hypothetical protein